MNPVKIETTKSGIEICSGKPKLIIIGNWQDEDDETGFIKESSVNGVLSVIVKKMLDMKFTNAKTSEQNVMILGDTIIIMQSPRSSGKLLKPEQAEGAARAVLEQYFKYATTAGYFDHVDPNKLSEYVEKEKLN